jgi:hypothetical protein
MPFCFRKSHAIFAGPLIGNVITQKKIDQFVSIKTITGFEISVSKQTVKSMRV